MLRNALDDRSHKTEAEVKHINAHRTYSSLFSMLNLIFSYRTIPAFRAFLSKPMWVSTAFMQAEVVTAIVSLSFLEKVNSLFRV